MRRLGMFMSVSLDGFFAGPNGDMSWAHRRDAEWDEYVNGNVKGESELMFGRVTYDMMVSYWPTPMAAKNSPAVAARMNTAPKIVFSRTLRESQWENTKVLNGDLVEEVARLKGQPGPGITILGSGSIVRQLTDARLIDEYQIVICPLVLGQGKSLFGGLKQCANLELTSSRAFSNGNVVLCCQAAA